MADASRLKSLRRGGLGAPPSIEEARSDLAPVFQQEWTAAASSDDASSYKAHPSQAAAASARPGRLDGRTMRRSNRTVQFATRVSPEFDERIRQIALRDGMLLVEVLEHALEAYEQRKRS
jgi:hypothetical protein